MSGGTEKETHNKKSNHHGPAHVSSTGSAFPECFFSISPDIPITPVSPHIPRMFFEISQGFPSISSLHTGEWKYMLQGWRN